MFFVVSSQGTLAYQARRGTTALDFFPSPSPSLPFFAFEDNVALLIFRESLVLCAGSPAIRFHPLARLDRTVTVERRLEGYYVHSFVPQVHLTLLTNYARNQAIVGLYLVVPKATSRPET